MQILLIDDEEKLRSLLARIISLEGFEIMQAGDLKAASRILETQAHQIDVVLCDVKLPDGNGVEFVGKIKSLYPQLEVILMTAYGNIPDGVQAIKNGAFDYIVKGDDNNRIIPLLHRAMEKVQLAKRVQQLERQLGKKHSFDTIIGHSNGIKQAIALAQKVAPSDVTVLLTGETGVGKEVFAQAIHQESARNTAPFVAINCAAFSRELLESELFGHRAGAFTGAVKDHKGLFEEAHRGTLFLDEMGEMPLDLQTKLLRVLETGELFRVGDSRPIRVNVRIIAATHRDLTKEVETGHFRQDLFYRISVFQIQLPPLRERVQDIEALALHFLRISVLKTNKKIQKIDKKCLEALLLHSWPGNIRELRNVVERSVILADGHELTLETLPVELQNALSAPPGQNKVLSAFELASAEKIHIQKVLNYTRGNKTKTAELLGIALTTLYRKMTEYGLEA
ncbi:MAG: sigma-54 dependent transcriptional regulator [Saprospiraceae bacterium]|nr:sigma-54 dependent transcriptional regulator [Saprospiraceae bacterium]